MIKESDRSKSLTYYHANKAMVLAKQKIYKRQHILRLADREIRGVNKAPYPEDGRCPCCGTIKRILQWHHWADSDYNDGLWMCTKCHFVLGNLFRQMPLKAEELRRELKNALKS